MAYKATLSQSQGRDGWSVIFRHPILLDRATGKPGRRVRRGLGTKNEREARALVAQLNQILADKLYWEPSGRTTALTRFAPLVVDIFYHDLLPEPTDAFAMRDAVIPLPNSADSAYRQVLLLGTTGGGKTTLVRQLIGTDPETERFPSTSTAKTTVADTEIVLTEGPFRAAVTFLPRDQVRDYVEECMVSAALAAYHREPESEMLRRLLTHVDQRFRLLYVLGNGAAADPDDDLVDEVAPSDVPSDFDVEVSRNLLASSVAQLRVIALSDQISISPEADRTQFDERVLEELFEEALDTRLRDDERFQTIADELMEEIERRFELLKVGSIEKTRQGWPRSWSYETKDRATFLQMVSRFSSNYAPLFGTLLTPLVSGLRVAGPFKPTWLDRSPPLVLFDVEGLGHMPETVASLSTAITRRLQNIDAVLLVDNAMQPMQAGTVSALRNLAAGGRASKLIVCFTHFDGVVGDNLPTFTAKEQHVLASAEGVLIAIGQQLGPFAERGLRQRLQSASFFFGGLQNRLTTNTKSERRTLSQLQALLDAIDRTVPLSRGTARSAGGLATPSESRPVYDRLNLVLAVKQACEDFQAAWKARLGIHAMFGTSKDHWIRIKALVRRFAERWDDEYLELRPLADLIRELQESIYRFIQNPISWTGPVPSDDERQRVFDAFAEEITPGILVLGADRVVTEKIQEWKEALAVMGERATYIRAEKVAALIAKIAPVPDVTPAPDRNQFLRDVIEVVRESAEDQHITLL
jgi:hypothetical protein